MTSSIFVKAESNAFDKYCLFMMSSIFVKAESSAFDKCFASFLMGTNMRVKTMGKVLCTVCSSVAHLCFVELTANQRENFCTVLSQMCSAQICTKHEIVLAQDSASISRQF